MIHGNVATLLPFDTAALSLVRAWINDETVRHGTGTEGPVSDFEHQRWYETAMADRSQRIFVIGMGKGSQATPVGLIGLRGLNWRSRNAEYWIYIGDGSARGKGVADEASRLLLRFAFDTLGLHRVFLQVDTVNERAIRLYQRLGFKQEGVMRQVAFLDGAFVDRILFSILVDEFKSVAVD
jgi:RimJ/RimL family protein N-acetyltransferase